LDEIFEHLKRRPLFAGEMGIRLSLAGAQDKLAVRMIGDKLALMRGGAPTTHILKTLIAGREGIIDSVHNEIFCLMLAERCGIPAPRAQMRYTTSEPYLLVERYDRKWQGENVVRLHQEDFCQALSVPPENKYEREGGPGISACLDEIQKDSVQPIADRIAFLNTVIFNYLIGNSDAHGKNFSFLHEQGKPCLAPSYDLLSTAVYPDLSNKMAMKIGSRYEPRDIHLRTAWFPIPRLPGRQWKRACPT
jgi:serine/threonine-protein kinase HipA